MSTVKKKILVAPLHWGLGHATRCIPIIKSLKQHDFIPLIASDGAALALLRKEFPELDSLELPSYNISYPKKGQFLKYKLIKDAPKILKAIKMEREMLNDLVKKQVIDGIISDNRYGLFHPDIPSVFITHQIRVFSGATTWLSTKIHLRLLACFDQCWIPDVPQSPSLSGAMSHNISHQLNVKYIGPLSRFRKTSDVVQNDVLVLLSGPEPQRTILEKKLLIHFKEYPGKVLFVKGIIEDEQKIERFSNFTIYNFMTTEELELALNESGVVISRSGYSTLMELASLGKKAFFIPTPGQHEQQYLAKKMKEQRLAPYCKQDNFSLENLKEIQNYRGLKAIQHHPDFQKLFDFLKGE